MDINIINRSVGAYKKYLNMRLASREIGIPLSTLYLHLKRAGVAIIGDKSRYGTESDKLAARAEKEFMKIVPFAKNMNSVKFQSKVDYMVGEYSIDVKASRLRNAGAKTKSQRWSFSLKKQELIADFFVCFAFDTTGEEIRKVLLIPGEVCRMYSSLSLSQDYGKWSDYEVTEQELHDFFVQMTSIPKEQP